MGDRGVVKKLHDDGKRGKMQREKCKRDTGQIEKDLRDILSVNNCYSAF